MQRGFLFKEVTMLIEIKNLTKIYKSNQTSVVALENISLTIKKGDVYGIIGLSGAGKSTLVRCINLLEPPTEGAVIINGQDITHLSTKEIRKIRQKIGMIFQHFNLLNSRTVLENIMFPLEIAGVPKEKRAKRAQELLELVNLEDKGEVYPAQLSGGQKQRVGIARALANEPEILLCDEATSALDPQTTLSILQLLKSINKKLNITMVVITHEMEVIKNICNEVAVIEGGQIVEKGNVLNIFTNPQHPTTQSFLGQGQKHLPDNVLKNLDGLILKAIFIGDNANKPLIADLQYKFSVTANILWGNIENIQDTLVGKLILQLNGRPEAKEKALQYLKEQNVHLEVVKNA